MAKDDYYVLVCKILVFLYKRLKKKDLTEPNDYIAPFTEAFPVDQEYLEYVVEQMVKQGFVEKVLIHRAWGGDVVMMDYSRMRITPAGIDYLRENNTMRKIVETLKEAIPIMGLFT